MTEIAATPPSASDLESILQAGASYDMRKGLVIALIDTMHIGERRVFEEELRDSSNQINDGIGHWSDLAAITANTPYVPYARGGNAGADFDFSQTADSNN